MNDNEQSLYIGPHHWWLATVAVLCFLFSSNEILQRALIQVEGTIVSSQTTTGNRPATYYVLHGADGVNREYVSGATDSSLPRRLSVGTYIKKDKYKLSWQKNQNTIIDFPLYFYMAVYGVALALAYWSYSQWSLNRS
jgi:hypothetical protein